MAIIRNFHYAHQEITALCVDTNSGNSLWLGFKQDANGLCKIRKVSANDPSQTYFDFDLAVTSINKMFVYYEFLFVGVDHATTYFYIYDVFNPLNTPEVFSKPIGVNEAPVDVVEGDYSLWWLCPGNAEGENAKILSTDIEGVLNEIIDLKQGDEEVKKATSLAYKDGELWVVTYTDPVELWRVYQDSGWKLQKNEMI